MRDAPPARGRLAAHRGRGLGSRPARPAPPHHGPGEPVRLQRLHRDRADAADADRRGAADRRRAGATTGSCGPTTRRSRPPTRRPSTTAEFGAASDQNRAWAVLGARRRSAPCTWRATRSAALIVGLDNARGAADRPWVVGKLVGIRIAAIWIVLATAVNIVILLGQTLVDIGHAALRLSLGRPQHPARAGVLLRHPDPAGDGVGALPRRAERAGAPAPRVPARHGLGVAR